MRAVRKSRGRVGGKLEPPGQGRRSRLACPPTDLRERARATSGSKKYVWGRRSRGVSRCAWVSWSRGRQARAAGPRPAQQAHLPTHGPQRKGTCCLRLKKVRVRVGEKERVHAVRGSRGHGGGKLEPPGQGRRSRLACPPTDLRERARAASGSKKYVWGRRSGGYNAVYGSRGHGAGSSRRAKAGAAGSPASRHRTAGGAASGPTAPPPQKKKRGSHEDRSPVSGLGRKRGYGWGCDAGRWKEVDKLQTIKCHTAAQVRHVLLLGHVTPKRSRSRTSKANSVFPHLITANKL
jgi:hypothetical protein